MINKTFFALSLNVLLLTNANATDYMLTFGAGGEPAGKPDTIFDHAFNNLSDYTKRNPDLKVDIALNGGHSKTESILQNGFPNASSKSNFLAEDYNRLLKKYKDKLESGEMVSGDQLMIFIDTHGAEKQDQFKSHSVATSAEGGDPNDKDKLTGAQTVDLDQLEVIKKLARQKGVKLAIVDTSCHSGNTLALADDNTCVISATGPKHYGYGTFAENFTNNLIKGKSLEQVFLESREEDDTPNFPMISSPSGMAVNSMIYANITPFLYHFDPVNDKLLPYLEANSGDLQQCIANKNYDSLLSTINFAEEMSKTSNKSSWGKGPNFSKLKKLLAQYKTSLKSAADQMRALNIPRLQQEENITCAASNANFRNGWTQKYTWANLLKTDFQKLITDNTERLNRSNDEADKTTLMTLIDLYTKAGNKKAEILAANPDLSSVKDKEQEIKTTIESTYFTNQAIAKEERKLYASLYQEAQSNQTKPENACQSFKI